MARMDTFFTQVFSQLRGNISSQAETVVWNAWVNKMESSEKDQQLYAQKLVDWYNRDTTAVRGYVREAARPLFSTASTAKWLVPVLNMVPRVVKRISLAYVQPPVRTLKQGSNTVDVGSPLWERVYGEQGLFKNIDINKKLKHADRWSTLLNTVHIEVVPRNGAIDWDFRLRPATTIIPDPGDYLRFAKLAYRFCPMDPDTLRLREGWVYWSKDVHAYRLDNGEWFGISTPDGRNPYGGEIPIVTVRKIEQDDYWGAYGADLVEGFEQLHVQLANMWFNAIMQSHGQPVGTNLKIPAGQSLVVGPDAPLLVEGVLKDDVPPSLVFAKPESETKTVQELLEWFIENCTQGFGLPPGSWSIDTAPESGFAKFMKNIELLEDRDDSRAMWVQVEKDLLRNSIMVNNRFEGAVGALPENLDVDIEFPPVKFPESPAEIQTRYTIAFNNGTSSPVRYFMEQEGLNEEDAKAKAIAIATEAEEVRAATADMEAARMKKLGIGPFAPAPTLGNKPPDKKE